MSRFRKKTGETSRRKKNPGSALKWILITGLTILALLFFGLFGLTLWLKNYRNSEAFRSFLFCFPYNP